MTVKLYVKWIALTYTLLQPFICSTSIPCQGADITAQGNCKQLIARYLSNANIALDGKSPLERLLEWQMDRARQAEEVFAKKLLAGKHEPGEFTDWHLDQTYTDWRSCTSSVDTVYLKACLKHRKKNLTYTEIQYFDDQFLTKLRKLLPGIHSVFDFGSGRGDFLKFHFNQGTKHAFGIQPDYMGSFGFYTTGWDFANGPVQLVPRLPEGEHELKLMQCAMFGSPNTGVDLVESFEVFEHIPRSLHCSIINILAKLAQRWVVVTMARIRQLGHDHVANRQKVDFMSEWTKRGLIYRSDLTIQMLDACPLCSLAYLTDNLLIFEVNSSYVHEVKCDDDDQAHWAPYEDYNEQLVRLPYGHTVPTHEYSKVFGTTFVKPNRIHITA